MNDATRPGLSSTHDVGRYQLVCEVTKSQLGALWVGQNAADLVCIRRVPKAGIAGEQLDWLSEVGFWAMELQHPNVAATSDVVMTDAELAIVSSYVEGESLRSLLRLASFKRKPLPAPVALRIAKDALEAVAFAESQEDRPSLGGSYAFGGLVPDSVLVGQDGKTLLLDAGLAGVIARIESMARHPEMAAYAAPEMIDGGDVDRRSDVFSAGVMLWEMLAGRRLFVGANHAAVAERVKTLSIPRADATKPIGGEPVPANVADLVARALERDPAARFDGAASMLQALGELGDDAVASPEDVAAFVDELAGTQLAMRRKLVERKTAGATPAPPAAAPRRGPPPPPRNAPKPTLLGIAPPTPKHDSIHPDILDDPDDEAIDVAIEAAPAHFSSEPPTVPVGEPAPHFTSEAPTVPTAKSQFTSEPPTVPTAKPLDAERPTLDVPPPPASLLETVEPTPDSVEPVSLEPMSLEPVSLEPAALEPAAETSAAETPATEAAAAEATPAEAAATEAAIAEAPTEARTLEPATLEPEDNDIEPPPQSAVLERRKRMQKMVVGVLGGMVALIVLALIVSALRKPSGEHEAAPAATPSATTKPAPSAPAAVATPEPEPTAAPSASAAEAESAAPPEASASAAPSAEEPAAEPTPPAPAPKAAPAYVAPRPRPKPKPKHKFTPSGI